MRYEAFGGQSRHLLVHWPEIGIQEQSIRLFPIELREKAFPISVEIGQSSRKWRGGEKEARERQ